ncbi:hypothetical protein MKX01_034198 [Papaver californicum]|nr:hypothetical protein MKX01_034198 [Papaver californicum]
MHMVHYLIFLRLTYFWLLILQAEYENQEIVGILDCGHEYHRDCISQWLLEKNVCAICKRRALPPQP